MAVGYVIALVLIGAGSALFVVSLLMVRQEAQARAENLKIFLKTGLAPTAPLPTVNAPRSTSRQSAEILPLHVVRSPEAEAAHALRRAYYSSRVRSAAAYAENSVLGNGHLAPGMAVLTKPFAIEAMAARIRSMIEGSKEQARRL